MRLPGQVGDFADGTVGCRVGGQILFAKLIVDRVGNEQVNDRKHRHAQNHARKAEEAGGNGNGRKHPEARNADGVAENLRPDDVAVHLLQDKNEDDKIERLQRVHQQNEERARHKADDRPEERDDIRHADDRGDQSRVRHFEDQNTDVTQNADDGGIDDLTDDEAVEHAVDVAAEVENMIGSLGREQGDDDFLALRLKCLLRPENIDRRDKADEEVHKALDKGDYGTGERGQKLLHVLQKRRGDPVVDKVVDFAERCIDVALDFGIILQNGRDPAVDTGIVCLRVVHDSDDALIQLRQQHGEECVQNQNGHDNADKDAR